MPGPILYDTHMHTPLCNHAEGEPELYAHRAIDRGLAGILFTCHNPMPTSYGNSGRMGEDQVEQYLAMVERCGNVLRDQLDVRVGLECDFFPGYEAYVQKTIEQMPLTYIIGSVHPHLAIWRRTFASEDPVTTQKRYFDQLAAAAESGLFDCISHPDLIKNMTADAWNFSIIEGYVAACLDRIAATGVSLELNTSGRLKKVSQFNPLPEMLAMMREREITVVIGSDAHVPHRVGDGFEDALGELLEAGYSHVSYYLDRTRRDVPINQALGSLIDDRIPRRRYRR